MRLHLLLLLFSIFLFSQSCKNGIDSNDLGAVIEGNFKGILKMNGDSINDFKVQLVRLSETTVMLNSSECNEIEVLLEGDGTFAILGNADTLDNFNYLVEEEALQFFVNAGAFKIFEGNKE